MDDTYLWSYDREHLQASLAALEQQLRRHGLTINPSKTAIIFSRSTGGGSFHIGGEEVACRQFGEVITALGSPITFAEEVAAIVVEMHHRARRAFHKHANLLCAPTSLGSRLKLQQTLVRGAVLWGGEAWQITDAILSSTQLQQIRRMMHPGRRPGETWEQWHVRTMRAARVALHKSQVPRWSSLLLQRVWDVYGHMARAELGGRPMLTWKNLQWWGEEVRKPRRERQYWHQGRFNAHVDPERNIVKVAGEGWVQVAADLKSWGLLAGEFVTRFDVQWSSGQQGSLMNLTPNSYAGGRRQHIANEAAQLTV